MHPAFRIGALALVSSFLFVQSTQADFVDGNFDNPIVASGGFQTGYVLKNVGASFGGPTDDAWDVVKIGSNGGNQIAITHTTEYTGSGTKVYYNAHSGEQWIDLTGATDDGAMVGVSQSVATTPGVSYNVSYAVGHFALDGPAVGVELWVDGSMLASRTAAGVATTPYLDGLAGMNYEVFTDTFTAVGSSTTIEFYNTTPVGAGAAGLDTVSVVAIPEPTTIALLLAGAPLALKRRRA